MPKVKPYTFRKLPDMATINPLLDDRHNKPEFSTPDEKEIFYDEYKRMDSIIRSRLREFGEIDAFGEAEFSMGNPWNNCRNIDIVVNSKKLFSEKLIAALRQILQTQPEDYLITLSGEYTFGGGNFYICMNKDNEIVGYAPRDGMLEPFGFQ